MIERLKLLILAGVAPLGLGVVVGLAGCRSTPVKDPLKGYDGSAASMGLATVQDVTPIYRQMGLVARYTPVPFVGRVSYFATNSPDTTLALFSVSLPNHGLTFIHEMGKYRAQYQVQLQLTQGQRLIKRIDALEVVRVGTFKETSRTDESIIFQQALRIPPGAYSLAFLVRDGGSGKTSIADIPADIPRFKEGTLSSLITVYEAAARVKLDSAPRFIAAPRSTAIFGRDSIVNVYIEGYGSGKRMPLAAKVANNKGKLLWSDTVFIDKHGPLFSGIVHVPVARADIGVSMLTLTRLDSSNPVEKDSASTPVFVGFGEDLPMMEFSDMLTYLRFFATSSKIKSLREAPPEKRASLWAAFLRATDPVPISPQHEALEAYFGRIQEANVRFRDDGNPGWLSNRGMTFVSLGEPDNILDETQFRVPSRRDRGPTPRIQTWEYQELQTRISFFDDGALNRWKFTRGSEAAFWSANAKRLAK